jgi:hypothetical protein
MLKRYGSMLAFVIMLPMVSVSADAAQTVTTSWGGDAGMIYDTGFMWPDLNTVHVDATVGFGNDRLFLRFETYTPNFSHFEVDVDDTGWKKVGDHWTWLLQSGRNTLRVRAVTMPGVKGKPSTFVINHANRPFAEFEK